MTNSIMILLLFGAWFNASEPTSFQRQSPFGNPTSETHPFYVSLCNIEHNPKTKQMEVSVKVYVDDLEKVMELETKKKLQIATPKESTETNNLVYAYLQKKVGLSVNGKRQELKFLGKEVDNRDQTAIWIYLYAEKIVKVKDVEIRNEIFLDVLPGQSNVTHLKIGSSKQSFNFREGHFSEKVKL